MGDDDDDAAELAQLHRSGHASQIRKRPSRTVADKASRQGRLLYKVGGRHWRLRHVELTGRLIKCYKVDEEMAPIKDQECEEVDLLGATLRLNPAKHKFTVVTPAGDDGKAPLHGFRTEGEETMEAWVVDLTTLIEFYAEVIPGGKPAAVVTTVASPCVIRESKRLLSRITRSSRSHSNASETQEQTDKIAAAEAERAAAEDLQCRKEIETAGSHASTALEVACDMLTAVTSADPPLPPQELDLRRCRLHAAVDKVIDSVKMVTALARTVDDLSEEDAEGYAGSLNQELASFVHAADGAFAPDGTLEPEAPARVEAASTASQLLSHTLFAMFQQAGLRFSLGSGGRNRSFALSASASDESTMSARRAALSLRRARNRTDSDSARASEGGAAVAEEDEDGATGGAAAAPTRADPGGAQGEGGDGGGEAASGAIPEDHATPMNSPSPASASPHSFDPDLSTPPLAVASSAAPSLDSAADAEEEDFDASTTWPVARFDQQGGYDPTTKLGALGPDAVRRASIAVALYNQGACSTFEADTVSGLESALHASPPAKADRVQKRRQTLASARRLVEALNADTDDPEGPATPADSTRDDGGMEGGRPRGRLSNDDGLFPEGPAAALTSAEAPSPSVSASADDPDDDAELCPDPEAPAADADTPHRGRDSTYGSISVTGGSAVALRGSLGDASAPAAADGGEAERRGSVDSARGVDSMFSDDFASGDEADAGSEGGGSVTGELSRREHTVGGWTLLRVHSGSPKALLDHLLSSENEDPEYLPTFLLCFQTFLPLPDLVTALLRVHASYMAAIANDAASPPVDGGGVTRQQHKRACYVLSGALDRADTAADPLPTDLSRGVAAMVRDLIAHGRAEMAQQLRRRLHQDADRTAEKRQEPAEIPLSALHVSVLKTSILELSSVAVARELTRRDAARFGAVKESEIFLWRKVQSREKSPSVYAMIDHFNQVSLWAASLILNEHSLRDRARMYCKIVDVAKHLRKLHSFNSLLAVLSAFHSSAVHRLKQTAEMAGVKTRSALARLQALMSHADHYATLRAVLATTRRPAIPYLGMYLTDITLVHHGNPDYLDPDKTVVNFGKCRRIFEIIRAVRQFHADPQFALGEDIATARVLGNLEALSSNDLYDLSLHVEPRQPPPSESAA